MVTLSGRTFKTRLLFITGALFVLLLPATAQAQTANETAQLLGRIQQLENQIQTISRAIFRGDRDAEAALAAAASAGDNTAAANFEVRMSLIEEQQRNLTGQLEQIGHDLQQMKSLMERMQADTDQRLQLLERGGITAVTAPPAAGASADPASGILGTLGQAPGNGSAEALYEVAFAGVRDGEYDQAETKFREFLARHPGHPLSANAQYWLGETYYVRGDYKQAAKAFAQGYQDFPKSGKAADSLFKLALSLDRLNKKDDACLSLRQLQKEFQSASGPLYRKAMQEIKRLGCS